MKKPRKNFKCNFNQWAKRYDETVRRASQTDDWIYKDYQKVLNQVVSFAQDILEKPHLVVVDLGVGTGNLAQKFIEKVEYLIGIDSSPEMLKIAKEKLPTIEIRESNFLKIPVEDNFADLVISSYAFHHLTEKEKMEALEEMSRILKSQGKIIIADLMFTNQKAEKAIKSRLKNEGKTQILAEIEEEYYGYVETLARKFAGLGFSTQEIQMTDFVWVICGNR